MEDISNTIILWPKLNKHIVDPAILHINDVTSYLPKTYFRLISFQKWKRNKCVVSKPVAGHYYCCIFILIHYTRSLKELLMHALLAK